MKKRRCLAVAEEEDYFGRLPDDVIIDIFGRVNDSARFLINCLLLSKRIESLIRLVTSISINIHPSDAEQYNLRSTSRYTILSSNLVCFRFKLIDPLYGAGFSDYWKYTRWPYPLDKMVRLHIQKAREGFHPFSNVKSAIIQRTKFKYTYVDRGIRWMLEYSGGGVNTGGFVKSCAFLGKVYHHIGSCELESYTVKNMILTWVADLFHTAFSFYPMVAHMAHDHESLCDILVTTTPRKGLIHAGEDEIVKMRQDGSRRSADHDAVVVMMKKKMPMKVKAWFVNQRMPSVGISTYAFVVVSSPDNIDQEVKAATRRFWGDCGYRSWRDDEVIQAVIERTNIRELVETMPCHLEFDSVAHFRRRKARK